MAMDRVTKSYVTAFQKSYGYEKLSESEAFEYFVNYTILDPKSATRFELDSVNIGVNGTIGIDGFALLLNNQLINSREELEDFMEENKKCEAEVVFIQSKIENHFDSKEIRNFGSTTKDFISERQSYKWTDNALDKISLFNDFVSRISELKNKPICSLYYVTLASNENDQNVMAVKEET